MPSRPDNRERILHEALRLFVSRGYDGVGIQEIVEAADVTKPTLYHYFGSKRGLLEALLAENHDDLDEELNGACLPRHDVTQTLESVARVYFTFARSNPDFYRLLLSLWFTPAESEGNRTASKHFASQFEKLERLFEEAAQDHGNMRGRQRAYAVTFLGLLNNYIGLALNGHARLDEPLMRQALHQYMHGIFS